MKALINIFKNEKMLVLFDQAFFSGTGFMLTIFLARILTTENFGTYSGVILLIYLALSLTNAIVIQPLQVGFHKKVNPQTYLTFTFILQLVIIFFLISLLQLVLIFLKMEWLNKLGVPVSLLSLTFLLFDYFRKVSLATNKVIKAFEIDFLTLATSACIILFIYTNKNLSLNRILSLQSLTYLPSLIYILYNNSYSLPNREDLKKYLSEHFAQGGWLILVAALQWLSSNFFIMVSGIYLGVEALGAFRFVQSLFGILNVLLQTFENYVLPKVSSLYSASAELSKKYLHKITIQGFIFFFAILILLSLFSKQVITLSAGEKYSEYDYVIKLMALLYLIIYLGYPIRLSIRMLLLNKSFFGGYLLSFVFSLVSFHLLIKYGHLTGCIVGLLLNQLLMLIYWYYILTTKKFSLWK